MATGLVQQPSGAPQPGDPLPHRLSRSLPNGEAIIRPVGAVLAEQTDELAEARRYLSPDTLKQCQTINKHQDSQPDTPPTLTF